MKNNVFITGATGFLGSLIIKEILSSSEDMVHVLVRDKYATLGKSRLVSLLDRLTGEEELGKNSRERIKTWKGDVTHKDLGLNKEALEELIPTLNTIYHSAAATDLNAPLQKAEKINAQGTQNLLDFATACKEKGRLKKVNHLSTAYIAGSKTCIFKEDNLDIGQSFNNTYEESKFEAEKIVNEYRRNGLDVDIFRPGIILGRYTDGRTTNYKMFYQPLHFFSMELFDRIPARGHSKANLINVDIAARAIFLISTRSNKQSTNYHIVSPKSPNLDFILQEASEFFGFRKPDFVKPEDMDLDKEYSFIKRRMIKPYIPYFNYLTEFTMENTLAALKKEKFTFPEFDKANLKKLFEYCVKKGFIKRKRKRNAPIG